MSQQTCVISNELFEASVAFQNIPTNSDEEGWSDAESDKFEDLNDIFGSPATDFSYDQEQVYGDENSSDESSKDELTSSDGLLATKVGIFKTSLN